MKQRYHCNDHPVQVWREERQAQASVAPFYKDIFDVSYGHFGVMKFVPAFQRAANKWPPALPADVDMPNSEEQARIFSAVFADYTITPDEELAGQTESFCFSFPTKVEAETTNYNHTNSSLTGTLFYVTAEQFALFSKELLEIEKHTFWANQYIALSKVKDFECMKLIKTKIGPIEQKLWAERERHANAIFGSYERNQIASTKMPELVPA